MWPEMPNALLYNDYHGKLEASLLRLGYTVRQATMLPEGPDFLNLKKGDPGDGAIIVLSEDTCTWNDFEMYLKSHYTSDFSRKQDVRIFHVNPSNRNEAALHGVIVVDNVDDLEATLCPITEEDVQAAIDSIKGAMK